MYVQGRVAALTRFGKEKNNSKSTALNKTNTQIFRKNMTGVHKRESTGHTGEVPGWAQLSW